MNTNRNISQEEWEVIESYLLNTMQEEERIIFEAKLSRNNGLQAKTEEVRLLLLGVKEVALKEKLNEFHADILAEPRVHRIDKPVYPLKRWLIAAAIIIITGIGGWFLLFNKSQEDKLFAVFFKPDAGLITAMSSTDNYSFDKAMIDYKTGEYRLAIEEWTLLQKDLPANDTLHYFLGVAHLANRDIKQAINELQQVTSNPSSVFRKDAYWYLGLALLKEGRREESKSAIISSNHPSKIQLLEKLK